MKPRRKNRDLPMSRDGSFESESPGIEVSQQCGIEIFRINTMESLILAQDER